MSEKKVNDVEKKYPKENGGLTTVLERNLFYYDQYKKTYLILLMLLVVNVLLIVAIVYKVLTPVRPKYFAASATGQIIKKIPLNKPAMTQDFVLRWTAEKVADAFNIDYVHWRTQLQRASTAFTQTGWRYFNKALKDARILDLVVKGQRIASVTITGAPQLIRTSVINGIYFWQVRLPLTVRYIKPGADEITSNYFVNVIVLREPVDKKPDRVAINNFIPQQV